MASTKTTTTKVQRRRQRREKESLYSYAERIMAEEKRGTCGSTRTLDGFLCRCIADAGHPPPCRSNLGRTWT